MLSAVWSKTRDCPNAIRASESLDVAASMLTRGVGEGSDAEQLHDAYDQMRPIADAAKRTYCDATP